MACMYKHEDPVHLKFGRTHDSSLLRKRNRYEDGGIVTSSDSPGFTIGDEGPDPGAPYGPDNYQYKPYDESSAPRPGPRGSSAPQGSVYVPKPMTGPCGPGHWRNNDGRCVSGVQTN
jgi:hypothetical protein